MMPLQSIVDASDHVIKFIFCYSSIYIVKVLDTISELLNNVICAIIYVRDNQLLDGLSWHMFDIRSCLFFILRLDNF